MTRPRGGQVCGWRMMIHRRRATQAPQGHVTTPGYVEGGGGQPMGDQWYGPTAPPATPGLVFEPGYGYRPGNGPAGGPVPSAVPCDPALPTPAGGIQALAIDVQRCRQCGAQIVSGAAFCPGCGARVR
mmetsp:Transcript_21966/g.46160  ORF Transcript_21966/g.46160 Transcript_21966/m.46160 type:complete len:128 (-) Transcript_21966:167-550(-)